MIIEQISDTTAARLATVVTTDTVCIAANALLRPGIGLLVACEPGGLLAGVISKSDIVRHLADQGLAAEPLTAVMTTEVVACMVGDELHEVWKVMTDRRLQNIPVLNAQAKPVGVLDVRDALNILLQDEEYQEQLLVNYVAGLGYR